MLLVHSSCPHSIRLENDNARRSPPRVQALHLCYAPMTEIPPILAGINKLKEFIQVGDENALQIVILIIDGYRILHGDGTAYAIATRIKELVLTSTEVEHLKDFINDLEPLQIAAIYQSVLNARA